MKPTPGAIEEVLAEMVYPDSSMNRRTADRFVPFDGNSIDFCEETCSLESPVNVRGLDAVLYDFVCLTDQPSSRMGGRVMILRQTGDDGSKAMSLITAVETIPIVRCP